MSQWGFYHDADACVGCKACVVACKDKNNLAVGRKLRRVFDYAGGSWSVDDQGVCRQDGSFVYSVSAACMHCAKPACVANCPAGAMTKRDDGIVYVNVELCIACGTCVKSCPYGQPFVDEDLGHSVKCDFCRPLIDQGEHPACVDACVTRALQFGELSDIEAAHGSVHALPPLPDDTGTEPSLVLNPSRLNPSGTLSGEVINPEEEVL